MNCKNCGELLTEDSKFCAACGTPVPGVPVITPSAEQPVIVPAAAQPVITTAAAQTIETPVSPRPSELNGTAQTTAAPVPAVQKKKSKGKPILIAVIAVAALAVIAVGIILAMNAFSGSGTGSSKEQMKPLLLIAGEDEVQIYGGEKKPVTIDGRNDTYRYSIDGKKVALTVDVDDKGLGQLWYCDGQKSYDVSKDVYNFNFSASGNKIAYLTDYDSESGVGNLNVYDIQTNKSKLIIEDALSSYALSSDGKSVSYAADVSTDDYGTVDGFTGYLIINGGKASELGKDQLAFALADGGSYVYYVEADFADTESGDLYIRHGKTDDKVGKVNLYSGFFFNRDRSEVMFTKSGSTYVCIDGGDKKKISSLSGSIYTPEMGQYYWNNFLYSYEETFNVSTMADQLLALHDTDNGGTTLSYLKKDFTTEDIDELNADYVTLTVSPDGKGLYYINDSGKIMYYKNYRDLKTDPQKIDADADITSFMVMPDQSAVYFLDADQTLWVQRGKSDPEEIASDVKLYSLMPSQDGKGMYFISDFEYASDADQYAGGGVLNYIKNAAKAKPDEIADNVFNVRVSEFGVAYFVYDSMSDNGYDYIGEAFFSQDGKDFKSVIDNAVL
ncbi:MAG: zinc ribbon domain-containing protein [Eubacteriales bacterium]